MSIQRPKPNRRPPGMLIHLVTSTVALTISLSPLLNFIFENGPVILATVLSSSMFNRGRVLTGIVASDLYQGVFTDVHLTVELRKYTLYQRIMIGDLGVLV
jgi:hypothetical protein